MCNNFLKGLRVMKGLTQDDMAKLLKISVKTYSRKESGYSDFTLTESKAIADLFKKTIDEIFFNKECNAKGTLINSA